MNILEVALEYAIDVVVGAAFLWLAMKLTARVIAGMRSGAGYCTWREILIASAAAAARMFPPNLLGWLLSWLVLFVLLKKFTGGSFGEVLLIVFISRVAVVVATLFALGGMLHLLAG